MYYERIQNKSKIPLKSVPGISRFWNNAKILIWKRLEYDVIFRGYPFAIDAVRYKVYFHNKKSIIEDLKNASMKKRVSEDLHIDVREFE